MQFLKLVEEQSGQKPAALANRPTLAENLWYFRDIFFEIGGSRNFSGEGFPMPIPISEILAYCQMFGIHDTSSRERLFKLLRVLDMTYLEVMREKAKAPDKNNRP